MSQQRPLPSTPILLQPDQCAQVASARRARAPALATVASNPAPSIPDYDENDRVEAERQRRARCRLGRTPAPISSHAVASPARPLAMTGTPTPTLRRRAASRSAADRASTRLAQAEDSPPERDRKCNGQDAPTDQ
jgi:hypothetical protein